MRVLNEGPNISFILLDKIIRDGSTIGGVHSVGSDQTRTRERSEMQNNTSAKDREQSHTPISMRGVMLSLYLYYQFSCFFPIKTCIGDFNENLSIVVFLFL